MASPKKTYEPTVADLQLIQAVEQENIQEVIQALENGANPSIRKKIRGLSQGESLILYCIRECKPEILELLLEAGGKMSDSMIVAAGMTMERAVRSGNPQFLKMAVKLLDTMDSIGTDWSVTDRFVGGGLRSIDLIANVNPQWAQKVSKRMKISLPLFNNDKPHPSWEEVRPVERRVVA